MTSRARIDPLGRRQAMLAVSGWLLNGCLATVRAEERIADGGASAVEGLIGALAQFTVKRAAAFVQGVRVPWADRSQRRMAQPSEVPVLRYLPAVSAASPELTRPLVQALDRSAHALTWRRSYDPSQVGEQFFENYGYCELVGLTGPVPSTELAVGFLLLGPRTFYPRHRHEALELYVPLSGHASWWQSSSGWRQAAPGTRISHARWEAHAMRTAAQPLLALYLWRSRNLAQHAELVKHTPAP